MGSRLRAVVTTAAGLEGVLADELRELGLRPKPGGPGVVEFDANHRQLYAAAVWTRTGERISARVGRFRATDFAHLTSGAAAFDWDELLPAGRPVSFRISSRQSKLFHTDAIADRLAAVVDRPLADDPEGAQQLSVRIERNTVTIDRDAGGGPLHHRSWRVDRGPAPLRPSMAAALLRLSGVRGDRPVADPFCGAGTIAIEAARWAAGLPADDPSARAWAFARWPDFDAGSWASVTGTVPEPASPADGPTIEASDRDAGAVAMTRANAERAGVADWIEIEERVVGRLPGHAGAGAIVTNPPFGPRLGTADLEPLWSRLGAVRRERRAGWSMVALGPDRALARAADRGIRPAARFTHGGTKVTAWLVEAAPGPARAESDPDPA